MLLAVMFVGQSALGAQRWIQLGPVSIQPSEFSKIIMIIALANLLKDKIRAYEEKGQVGRVLRLMVLGIPNVGKSTFINKVSGRKTAKTQDR